MDAEATLDAWADRTGEYSPEYYAYYGPDDTSERLLATLDEQVGRGASVLELGCSAGRHLAYLHEHGYEALAGVDVNADALDALLDAGDTAGLAVLGPEPEFFAPSNGEEHRQLLRGVLASHPAVGPAPPANETYTLPWLRQLRRRLDGATQLVVVSPMTDGSASLLARWLDGYGHPVTVVSPDPTGMAPIIIAATILVMTGPPVLYSQARLGRNEQEFRILKFRTLRSESDGPRIATPGDPRITSVGRVLRRFHLDELPQIFNILRGEMAFVGPRTEPPGIWAGVDADRRARLLRHRPGITSPASVEFLCEDDVLDDHRDAESLYREIVFPAKVERDLQYFERRSIAGDTAVVFRTLRALLSRDRGRCRRRVERLLRNGTSDRGCTQS